MHNLSLFVIGVLLAGAVAAADFEVGDRLQPAQADGGPAEQGGGAASYQELTWDDLLPADWDPMQAFEGIDLNELADLDDADPRADAALEKLKAMWNDAPANPAVAGKAIRIPGFLVPLEYGDQAVTEFLLVPYFGACIHVPPPPANQIIHVKAAEPYATESYMDAVWVQGVIELAKSQTDLGDSGYRLDADTVERYEEPR